ncbi:MAG: hypothetical protein FJ109_17770 [Deltaproteobacteria bacterium]|nr:hypothetical protein [Deltaproteobacteria bacterium]
MGQGRVIVASLVAAMLVVAVSGKAAAGEWSVRPELLTEYPLHVGAGVELQGPWRLFGASTLGWMPSAYLQATNDLLVAMFEDSGYTQETADLVESSLKNALVWRVRAGWQPWRNAGFYFAVGYTLAALGGDVSGPDVLEAVTGKSIPEGSSDSQRGFDVASALHLLDFELGWRWFPGEHWMVRAALGGAFTVGSSTSVDARFHPLSPKAKEGVAAIEREGEAYLDDTYTTYVHTPVVTAAVGYRF